MQHAQTNTNPHTHILTDRINQTSINDRHSTNTTHTICLFILYINKSILQTAATEGELSTNRVGLGDLAESVNQSALARAHVTCSISKNANLSSPLANMYKT